MGANNGSRVSIASASCSRYPLRATSRILGFFGPTYLSAEAATVHPYFFANGLSDVDTPPSSKVRAALDIIRIHIQRETAEDADRSTAGEDPLPLSERAKFAIHVDSLEAVTPVVWVSMMCEGRDAH